MSEPTNDFGKYLAAIDLIEEILKPDPKIVKNLRTPHRLIRSGIWVHRETGSFDYLPAWRCQFNRARGMTQGGTRFEPDANEDTVKMLAGDMVLKNAIVGIMHGGGKGVIAVNKDGYSLLEGELFCRGYIDIIEPYIGDHVDGPAPDVNTGGTEMAWFLDELEYLRGYHCTGSFTGKPEVLGGSIGRGDATALGGVYATEAMIRHLGLEGKQLSIFVDGYGNAGENYMRLITRPAHGGHIVVATGDRGGFIAKESGLPIDELYKYTHDKTGKKICKVTDYAKVDPTILTGDEALKIILKANICAPAANKNRIADVHQYKDGKIIAIGAQDAEWLFGVELANGPCTPEAIELLAKRKIWFIADIFSSGGGVRVSSAEKAQGLLNAKWTRNQVKVWLETQMNEAFKAIMATQAKYDLKTFRDAASIYAGEQIVEAMTRRAGLYRVYGKEINAMPIVVSATPWTPKVILKQLEVFFTNLDKVDTLLLRSIRRWLRPILAH